MADAAGASPNTSNIESTSMLLGWNACLTQGRDVADQHADNTNSHPITCTRSLSVFLIRPNVMCPIAACFA